jgi:hypothetical protein
MHTRFFRKSSHLYEDFIMVANAHFTTSDPFYTIAQYAHKAPTPEPIDDPLPGEHPVPQEDPVPSPNPEVPRATRKQ